MEKYKHENIKETKIKRKEKRKNNEIFQDFFKISRFQDFVPPNLEKTPNQNLEILKILKA